MPEKDYQYILVDRDERVGIVTLNRPKELNALNNQLVGELAGALEEFDRDEEIRCIVITGAGDRAFAAGADIKQMSDKSPIDMLLGGFGAWTRIKGIHKPLIAAVGTHTRQVPHNGDGADGCADYCPGNVCAWPGQSRCAPG